MLFSALQNAFVAAAVVVVVVDVVAAAFVVVECPVHSKYVKFILLSGEVKIINIKTGLNKGITAV